MKNIFLKKKVRQVGSLYITMGLVTLAGLVISVINTRLLGPSQYGDFKFLQNLFQFTILFFTVGIFVSGSRLVAQNKNDSIKHNIFGALLICSLLISLAFILFFYVFSFYEDQLFNNNLGHFIRILSPLLFVLPFQLCLNKIFQGDNRIYELSLFRITPRLLYIAGVLILSFFIPLTLTSALFLHLASFGIPMIFMIIRIKPNFQNAVKHFPLIWEENKTYGFPVYIGSLAGVASAKLSLVMIALFIDNIHVGYFALAITVTAPLTMIPDAIGTSFFKDFANRDGLPRRATLTTIVFSICSLVIFLIIIKSVFVVLYSEKYLGALPLTYIVSIGCILHGYGDYIGKFLGAHGLGKQIRNGAIAVGISNIFGYVVLTYFFGITGAAFTNILSSSIYLTIMVYYYREFRYSSH